MSGLDKLNLDPELKKKLLETQKNIEALKSRINELSKAIENLTRKLTEVSKGA